MIARAVAEALDSFAWESGDCCECVIERQLRCNVVMTMISHFVGMWIALRWPDCTVRFVHPRSKFRITQWGAFGAAEPLRKKTGSRVLKKLAVARVDAILRDTRVGISQAGREKYANAPKKDDFADALLQALAA